MNILNGKWRLPLAAIAIILTIILCSHPSYAASGDYTERDCTTYTDSSGFWVLGTYHVWGSVTYEICKVYLYDTDGNLKAKWVTGPRVIRTTGLYTLYL